MFGETTIFYIKIWNHPTETSIYKWLFGFQGKATISQCVLYTSPFQGSTSPPTEFENFEMMFNNLFLVMFKGYIWKIKQVQLNHIR